MPGRPADWRRYLRRPASGGRGEERLTWRNGLVTRVPAGRQRAHVPADGGAAAGRLRGRRSGGPGDVPDAGYVWNTWHAPHLFDIPPDADLADPAAYPDWFTRGVRRARRLAPDVSVHAEVFSPLTHLMELFGYEQALLALLDAPDTCHGCWIASRAW